MELISITFFIRLMFDLHDEKNKIKNELMLIKLDENYTDHSNNHANLNHLLWARLLLCV